MGYLIWSNEHDQWWGPHHSGCTSDLAEAGIYDELDAMRICGIREGFFRSYLDDGRPHEVMIPAPNLDIIRRAAAIRAILGLAILGLNATERRTEPPLTGGAWLREAPKSQRVYCDGGNGCPDFGACIAAGTCHRKGHKLDGTMPEPPDLSFVRTGDKWPFTFWWRDDSTNTGMDRHWRIAAISADAVDPETFARDEDPITWAQVLAMPNPYLVHLEDLTP